MQRSVLATLLVLAGCGAVFSPSQRSVAVNSNPPGAPVFVDGMPIGNTPLTVSVDNRRDHAIVVGGPGASMNCPINSSPGAIWVVLDIIFLPALLPIIIDAATGGWNEIDQRQCVALLPGAQQAPAPAPPPPVAAAPAAP